jgi:vacuolar protein 8
VLLPWATSPQKVRHQPSLYYSLNCANTNEAPVGDYSIFVRDWADPNGGIYGYLKRFLASGDPTFQHIAIWTLLQLLESEDKRLIGYISKSEDIVQMVKTISDKNIESDEEDGEDGEAEVVALARRCLGLLGNGPKQTLVEG